MKSIIRVYSGIILGLLLGVTALGADTPAIDAKKNNLSTEKPTENKDRWRLIFIPGAGQLNADFHTDPPVSYVDPRTGRVHQPGLGRLTGLTSAGSMRFDVRGTGWNDVYQLFLIEKSLSFAGGYSRLQYDMAPVPSNGLLRRQFEGKSKHNVYYGTLEYRFFQFSEKIAPVVAVNYFSRKGVYTWKNVVHSTDFFNDYLSLPVVDGYDSLSSNAGRLGLWFKLPMKYRSYIQPFVEYAGARYFQVLRPTVGSVVSQNSLYFPDDPTAILNAWLYQGSGNAYSYGLMGQKSKEFRKVGIKARIRPLRFLILAMLARYNINESAWNVGLSMNLMFHKNFGIGLSYAYVEPEVNELLVRSWFVGPVFTVSF